LTLNVSDLFVGYNISLQCRPEVSGYTAAEGGSEQTVGYEHNQHSHSEGNYYSQHPSALTLMQFTPSHRAKE